MGGGKAFGVAVPDVEIVATVPLEQMPRRTSSQTTDKTPLQKLVIRNAIDRLVNIAGFKFRRSAFRGRDPKVTFVVPSTVGAFPDTVPIDFFVNSTGPAHGAALLEKFGSVHPAIEGLALFVKRWAKDRGICHVAKGHLSPYAWMLLSIYYLQVSARDLDTGKPLLPARSAPLVNDNHRPGENSTCTAELFKGFLRFYIHDFDWCTEFVSVRTGRRLPAPSSFARCADGVGDARIPAIENPFDPTENAALGMTADSVVRLHEELTRAEALCFSEEPSLTHLLEPWKPTSDSNVVAAEE
jgi:DNA polymerase sigma